MNQLKENEEWRKIPGFSRYSVSNIGNVRRDVKLGNRYPPGPVKLTKWREYYAVSITDDEGNYKKMSAHTLVAAAFLGQRPDGMFVCHNNGNGRDNTVENLRYDTPLANMQDKKRHGTNPIGQKVYNSALTDDQAIEIRNLLKEGNLFPREIAEKYSVTLEVIKDLMGNRTYQVDNSFKVATMPSGYKKLYKGSVLEIRRLGAEGVMGKDIAKKFNVSPSLISRILNGKMWNKSDELFI